MPFMKFSFFFILIACTLSMGCKNTNFKSPTIEIETNFGDIYVELYPDKAPKTVAGFLHFVDSGYFKNASFYRVMKKDDQPSNQFKAELIQGGLWRNNYKKQESIPGIPHETTKETGILHKRGTISLARNEPGTASTEFFICLADQPIYDYGGKAAPDKQGFAAFGEVVKGMNVAREIQKQPDSATSFRTPIKILNIKRVK
jgi:peptidyl-prolyl cis-trans isomerase A (cyclophilin A)